MAELTRDDADAFVFNHWHELLPVSALVETLMDVVGQDLLRIDRDDAPIPDEECIRDVLAQQVDALPQRLTEMKLMSGCDHASVADHRRRA